MSMITDAPRLSQFTAFADEQSKARSFTRWAVALARGRDLSEALAIYKHQWPNPAHLELIEKAAVAPGSTTDATWASPIVPMTPLAAAFMELVRPRTVLGRLAGARRAPFNTRFTTQTAGTLAGWVGEGKPTPVQALGFAAATLPVSKLGIIVVITSELAKSSDPAALPLIERDLVAGIAQGSDAAFLDPASAAVPGDHPASITNGTTDVPSTGSTAAQVEADLIALIAAVNGGVLVSPVLVLKSETALYLARLRSADGALAFPGVSFAGGNIWGIPVLVSDSVGDRIVLIEANDVALADGLVDLAQSKDAALQMDSAPTSPPVAATVLISLWQENLVGVKATRYVSWHRARTSSAAYISGVTF
jgi:HK97 family phage major capsid protein